MSRLLTGSWLDNYLTYVKDTESPLDYNKWCGISVLGASLKRRVFMQRGFYQLFPNQYVVLVGPPGIGKGTAITPAIALAKRAQTVNYLSDRITAEKIIERLATGFITTVPNVGGGVSVGSDASATIISKELPVFLSTSDWMLPLLCQLWDENEFEYDTKNKGTKSVKDLCVGLLAGCVPDYIRRLNKDATTAISGGFTARCIFVYASEKSQHIAWPSTQINSNLENDLIADLKHISQLGGEVKFSQDAFKEWQDFYKKIQVIDKFEQEVVANFKSRSPTHVLKAAMTLSVAESDNLIIEKHHLLEAIKMVEDVAKLLVITFKSVGESPLANATAKVMDFIVLKGQCSRAEILRALHRDVTDEDLTRILDTLVKMGVCEEKVIKGRFWYIDITTQARIP